MAYGKKIFHWAPRILSMGFVLFLSVFALDVFSEYSGAQAILAFFVHLIPSLVLLAVALIAWKYDLVGAIVFIGFGVLYVWSAGLHRPWSWYVAIAVPAAAVGILFLISWFQKRAGRELPGG